MASHCNTALAVAALLATGVVANSDLAEDLSSEGYLSLLQLRSQYSTGSMDSMLSNATTANPQKADVLEYLSAFRPCATCKKPGRVGGTGDGGYVMCEELLSDVTGAYSFGIEARDTWGADISTRLGVTVHQADCFTTKLPPCPAGKTCNFDFQPVCVGEKFDETGPQKFETLWQQLHARGDEGGSGSLLLKMDIEGSEWSVFAAEDSKPLLKRFSQIIVEFHWVNSINTLLRHQEMQQKAMKNLMEEFVVVHFHQNNCCELWKVDEFQMADVVELTLVRRDLIEAGLCNPDPPQSQFRNVQEREDMPRAHLPGGTQPL